MKLEPITLTTGFTFTFTLEEYKEIQESYEENIKNSDEIVTNSNIFHLFIEPAIQQFIDKKLDR